MGFGCVSIERSLTLCVGDGVDNHCERVPAIVPDVSLRNWQWLHQRKLEGTSIKFFAVHYRGRDFESSGDQPSIGQRIGVF
jgi:hypothetical protein